MKTWFISDIHFGHFNVIKYSNRPFLAELKENQIVAGGQAYPFDPSKQLDWQIQKASVSYMNQTIINNWNSKINSEDKVYFLGDFAFLGVNQMKEICSQLNGYKILIKGNHDRSSKQMQEVGFNEVYDSLTLNLAGQEVVMSHYPYVDLELSEYAKLRPNVIKFTDNTNLKLVKVPYELDYEGSKQWLIKYLKMPINTSDPEAKEHIIKVQRLISKHIGTRLVNEGKILLHGHTHSLRKRLANMINLSVEAWNYFPASQEEIEELILEYLKEVKGEFLSEETCNSKEYDYYSKFGELNNNNQDLKTLKESIMVLREVVAKNAEGEKFVTYHVPRNYSTKWYELSVKYQGFIPMSKLQHGKFYKGRCRNALWAYWDAQEQLFYYIREKFGSEFVESICPVEKDNGFDLFVPQDEYLITPEEETKFWQLKR
jgi:calcineurin-like phosphoesterase family protein